MQLQVDNLGKVAITIQKGYWDINKDYDKLTVVEVEGKFATYISRKPVPAGTVLTNRKYWIPFSSLKEQIVIDYNKFIKEYSDKIDNNTKSITLLATSVELINRTIEDIQTNIKNIENRLDNIKAISDYKLSNILR